MKRRKLVKTISASILAFSLSFNALAADLVSSDTEMLSSVSAETTAPEKNEISAVESLKTADIAVPAEAAQQVEQVITQPETEQQTVNASDETVSSEDPESVETAVPDITADDISHNEPELPVISAAEEETESETILSASSTDMENEPNGFLSDDTESESEGETQKLVEDIDEETESASENSIESESELESESESETEEDDPSYSFAKVRFSGSNFYVGDTIDASITGIKSDNADTVYAEYQFPVGISFAGIKRNPKFDNGSYEIQYQTTTTEWLAYNDSVNKDSITALRLKGTGTNNKINQSVEFAFSLKATYPTVVESAIVTSFYKEGEQVKSRKTTAKFTIDMKDSCSIVITQDAASISKADAVNQTVSVKYNGEYSSKITYLIDSSLEAIAISVPSGSMYIGGQAAITSNSGTSKVTITESMDLLVYSGVTTIEMIPKTVSSENETADFTVTLKAKANADFAYSAASVITKSGQVQETRSYKFSTPIAWAEVNKPSLTYPSGNKVDFGASAKVIFGNDGVSLHGIDNSYNLLIQTPDFVTLDEIILPSYNITGGIEVYETANGTETLLGTFASGTTIPIGKTGVSSIRLDIVPEDGKVTPAGYGTLKFTNNDPSNTNNYFGFYVENYVLYKDAEYKAISDIAGVTFALHETANEPQPQTGDHEDIPDPVPVTPVERETEETEPGTEEDETRRAEQEKKQQIIDKVVSREEEVKQRQNAILANRVNALQGASGSVADDETSGSETKKVIIDPISVDIIDDYIRRESASVNDPESESELETAGN